MRKPSLRPPALKAEQINFRIFGAQHSAPPLVIIHGVGSRIESFVPAADIIAQRYKVILFDLRGHGNSADPGHGFEIETLAADLGVLLESLGIEDFHVAGHSAGAKIAMLFASRFPIRVLSVAIEDTGPLPLTEYSRESAEESAKVAHFLRSLKKTYDEISALESDLAHLYPGEPAKVKELAEKVLPIGTRESAVTRQLWAEFKICDTTRFLEVYEGPVLFLRSSPPTRYMKDSDLLLIKTKSKNAKISTVTDGTHSIHEVKPGIFAREVLDFLDSL